MKIEAGKFYKNADGEKVGPMIEVDDDTWDYEGAPNFINPDGTDYDDGVTICLVGEWENNGPDTLGNLDLKVGDVVECVDDTYAKGSLIVGCTYPCETDGLIVDEHGDEFEWASAKFKVVSRAADTPTIFKDMSDAEQGALLLAKYRGQRIQAYDDGYGKWLDCSSPVFLQALAYRIAPTYITGRVQQDADGNPDFSTWDADQ
jgi:hypothetical protein